VIAISVPALLHRIARGRHGASDLSSSEAEALFAALLAPDADDAQRAALWIAMRMKGETAEELAGFVQAARAAMPDRVQAPAGCLELACMAGMRRTPMWHLVAAARLARGGKICVLVHGLHPVEDRVSAFEACACLGIPIATSTQEASAMLQAEGIAYLDLACACPALFAWLSLRKRLGVRGFVHTVARLLNPLGCTASWIGCFHPPYALRMAEALKRLGQADALVVQGAEGDPLLGVGRCKHAFWLHAGKIEPLAALDEVVPKVREEMPRDALLDALVRAQRGELLPQEEALVAHNARILRALHERQRPWEAE